MSYRDDHDAALARVDALEQEVSELRADDATQADRIAYLEESLAEARRARDRAQTALDKLQPQTKPPADPPPPKQPTANPPPNGGVILILFVGVIALIAIVAAVVATSDHGHHRDEPGSPLADPKPQPVLPATSDPTSALIDEALHTRLATSLPGGFLEKITITAIDEAGTIHREYQGSLQVQFEREDAVPTPAPRPVGAPPAPKPENDGYSCVMMSHDAETGWVDMNMSILCSAMSIYPHHDSVTAPHCTPSTIWKLARADGATAGAIASITYDGSWEFAIRDDRAPFEHRYDDNCAPQYP